jgi:hypothetical protein
MMFFRIPIEGVANWFLPSQGVRAEERTRKFGGSPLKISQENDGNVSIALRLPVGILPEIMAEIDD